MAWWWWRRPIRPSPAVRGWGKWVSCMPVRQRTNFGRWRGGTLIIGGPSMIAVPARGEWRCGPLPGGGGHRLTVRGGVGDGGELFDVEAGSDSSQKRMSLGRHPQREKQRCVVASGWLRAVAGPAHGDLQSLATQRLTRGFLWDA
jgi:hypothetical protein